MWRGELGERKATEGRKLFLWGKTGKGGECGASGECRKKKKTKSSWRERERVKTLTATEQEICSPKAVMGRKEGEVPGAGSRV